MPQIYCRQVRSRGLRPDWDQVIKEVEASLDREVKPLFLGYFYRIVNRWSEEHRPALKAMKKITKQAISIYIYPTGPLAWLWRLVSITGARRHPIPVRNATFLKFLWGGYGSYKAKTGPRGQYKGSGEIEGGTWRTMLEVDHPGFAPRNFEKYIARWGKRKTSRIIGNAFRRGIYKAKARAKKL